MESKPIYLRSLIGVLLYNTFIDFLDSETPFHQVFVFLQYVVMSVPLLLILHRIQKKYYFLTLFLFLAYLAVISIGSTDLLITYNHFFKVFFSSIYLIIGYYMIESQEALKTLITWLLILMGLFIAYIVFSNVFGIGVFLYSDSGIIRTGYLTGARLYPYSLIVLLIFIIPTLFRKEKLKMYVFYSLAITSIILIIAITRRSAILILTIGFLLFILLKPSINNILKTSTFLVVVSFLALINIDTIMGAYELRSDRMSSIHQLTTERRFQEYAAVYETLKQNPITLIFGTGDMFNNRGGYGQFHWRNWNDRRIHSDYGILLHGGGITGLFLYLLFLFSLYRKAFRLKPILRYFKDLKIMLISFITIAFLISFVGGIYYVSYHTLLMLLIGGFTKLISNESSCLEVK